METIQHLLQYILHIDDYLLSFVSAYGIWAYAVLFAIIFCETGLVIFPFLPGDSLLFAAGSLAANATQSLNIQILFVLLLTASILGNKVNYLIGRSIGPKIFQKEGNSGHIGQLGRLLNQEHLQKAHEFYEKHGGKTIIFARFIPFFRTFVPFVAGISYMSMQRFTFYNIVSALLWIGSLLSAGYFFGNLPIIKENFSIAVYTVIAISLLPPIIAFCYRRLGSANP